MKYFEGDETTSRWNWEKMNPLDGGNRRPGRSVDDQPPHANASNDTNPSAKVIETAQVQYEFVENFATSAARSHAMRMYWRQKAHARDRQERDEKTQHSGLRLLLPSTPSDQENEQSSRQLSNRDPPLNERVCSSSGKSQFSLAEQLWIGIEFTFDSALRQKTEAFPFRISAENRKLLYHCEPVSA